MHAFFSSLFFLSGSERQSYYIFSGKHHSGEPSTSQEGVDSLVNHRACLGSLEGTRLVGAHLDVTHR